MKIPEELLPEIYNVSKQVYEREMKLTEGAQMLSELYNLNNGSANSASLVAKVL